MPDLTGLPGYLQVFFAILFLLGGGFGGWLLSVRRVGRDLNREDKKLEGDQKIAENQQAMQVYQNIVQVLQADRLSLIGRLDKLETEHESCIQQHAKLSAKCDVQDNDIQELREEICQLRQQVKDLKDSH